MLRMVFYFLVMPGFLASSIVGLMATWVNRKVTASLRSRVGPPWFQPFADICKLMGKETFVPEGSAVITFLSMPLVNLTAATLVSTMLCLFNANRGISFVGNLIVVLYLLTVPAMTLIIGGSASRNPLSALGSSREMKLILAYELPFLLAVFTMVARAKTLFLGEIIGYQAVHGMFIASFSGLLAFVVCLLAVQAKLGYVPFDVSEAEQEIMGGTMLEYSGPTLAVHKLTGAIQLFSLPVHVDHALPGRDRFHVRSWSVMVPAEILYNFDADHPDQEHKSESKDRPGGPVFLGAGDGAGGSRVHPGDGGMVGGIVVGMGYELWGGL